VAGSLAASNFAAARCRTVHAVAPELRSKSQYLPSLPLSRPVLAVGRRIGREPSPVRQGVGVREECVEMTGAAPVRVLVYESSTRPERAGALLWIHGGGLVLGSPEHDHEWCSAVADDLGVVVVNVHYRLAPEHPFPAALEDCCTALRWLHATAELHGVDPSRVAVGGSSAGGGLAAAVAQWATDEGLPLAFQSLRYPMLDDRTVLRRDHQGRGAFVWTPASNRFGWSCYLGRAPRGDAAPPYSVPSRRQDLSGLPPAWIGVGDLDLFLDEDVEYARRLQEAGVACERLVVPRMYHGADGDHHDAASMRDFRASQVEALRRAVAPTSGADKFGGRHTPAHEGQRGEAS
jgi:acetyl esterase/lipase